MPYISTERVKEIRNQLKKEFPAVKFSVTKHHHSGVNIDILSAPFPFEVNRGYSSVSLYDIKRYYTGEQQKFLLRVHEIADAGNGTLVNDADYGAVPNFYVNISLGAWDKPYQYIEPKTLTA